MGFPDWPAKVFICKEFVQEIPEVSSPHLISFKWLSLLSWPEVPCCGHHTEKFACIQCTQMLFGIYMLFRALFYLICMPNIFGAVKSRMLQWAGWFILRLCIGIISAAEDI